MITLLATSIVAVEYNRLFGLDASLGPLQVAMLMSAVVAAVVAHKNGHPWEKLGEEIVAVEYNRWGGFAATSLLIGFYLAGRNISNRTIGMIMGFGAGALISAIAYELVPESMLVGAGMALAFGSGALAFFVGDWLIDRRGGSNRKDIAGNQTGGSGAAIFVGTLLDNVPESIILGMGLALGGTVNLAFLAAVFVSNLPEGVAGSLNLQTSGRSRRNIFWMWAALVLVSAICAGLGYVVVRLLPGADGRIARAFAAGAMLTMLADAMMPEAFEHGGMLVGLFTVMGFLASAMLSVIQ